MKIIYLHQYFKTPEEGGAVRSFHLAKAMAETGHEVELITSHNAIQYQKKEITGFIVHYLPIAYDNSFGTLSRLKSFTQFAWQSYKLAKSLKGDLVYATSTPLTVGWTALRLKRKKGIPFIFEVRDIWPLAPKELGVIKNKIFLYLAAYLERKIYKKAKNIVALSPDMSKHILAFVPADKVVEIPNFGDSDLAKNTFSIVQKQPSEHFTIVYAGSFGYANDIDFLKTLIGLVKEKFSDQIRLRFMGDGKFASEIAKLCSFSNSATFLGFQNKQTVYQELALADACLTTFLPFPVLETNSPNKFFDGLEMETIALVNFGGWLADLIEKNNCGFRLTKENRIDVLTELIENPSRVTKMKANAKALAISDFDKERQIRTILKLLQKQ